MGVRLLESMGADAGSWGWKQVCAWLSLAAGMLAMPAADAHLMSLGFGAVQVREHDAVVLIGVPVAAFDGADDNGDGLLQPSEIKAHRSEILEQMASTFQLSVGGKVAVVREAHLIASVHSEDGVGAPQLEWWSLLDFDPSDQVPECVKVGFQRFTGIKKPAEDMVYTLQVRHAGEVQTAVFSKAQTLHSFGCALDAKVEPR